MTVTYDPHCYDLAELFLSDEMELDCSRRRHELARLIQEVVEDYLSREREVEEGLVEGSAEPVESGSS